MGRPRLRAAPRRRSQGRPAARDQPRQADDHPHWNLVAYMFHTRSGERVLVDRGDGVQVEGTLGGVRPARGQDELLVELEGTTWACTRADGEQWAPGRPGPGAGRDVDRAGRSPGAVDGSGVPAPGGACRPTWRVSRDADTRPGSLLRDARAAAAARGRRLPGLRGAQPRAVGGACPRHRAAAVHLARPARRDRELQHRGRLRDPQPRGPGRSSSSRRPVTSTRSSSCRARSSRWSPACGSRTSA